MALMTLETAELGPKVHSVRIKGQVDSSNLEKVKAAFDEVFAKGVYQVVLNLKETQYLSSSAIGCVIGVFTTAVKNQGRLVLASVPLQVMEVLRLIGLSNVLRFASDESSALQQF